MKQGAQVQLQVTDITGEASPKTQQMHMDVTTDNDASVDQIQIQAPSIHEAMVK